MAKRTKKTDPRHSGVFPPEGAPRAVDTSASGGGADDSSARACIVRELDTCMLVEAAAGTGKTRSMVDRMVELLAQGKCEPGEIAAVTFTRKAAAELRERFEKALETAVSESSGERRERLERSREGAARALVGTIHSFCARLLRERPVEAGVALDFRELDDAEDVAIREEAWTEYVLRAYTTEDPAVRELDDLGVEIGSLRSAFDTFCDYPDVEEWPTGGSAPPDAGRAAEALRRYLDEIAGLVRELPEKAGNDALIPAMRRVVRMARHADPANVSHLADIMEVFLGTPRVVQKEWPRGKDQALAERERWSEFGRTAAKPFLDALRERRYAVAMKVFAEARKVYDRIRRERGALNYQDLLTRAAALLRTDRRVREYFAGRFRRILVDEFQDTDPVQAEVLLLLAADDPGESDWRRSKPRPGALFLVGDPKQSIYRFRRADIATYMRVAKIVRESGGRVVTLSRNFRAGAALINWVNGVFRGRFPATATEAAPAYIALEPRREEPPGTGAGAVRVLRVPGDCADKLAAARYEARAIASHIHEALRSGRSPGEFMIITFKSKQLGTYARELERLGIPHRVTGGAALNDVEELALLRLCLRAASAPGDALALVGVLRSALFGVSDAQLWEFARAGGTFSYLQPLPQGLEPRTAAVFERAFAALRRCARLLSDMPPAAAARTAADELGLVARAASAQGGDFRAGSLLKAIELLRDSGVSGGAEAAEYLGRLVSASEEADRHDGASALPEGTDVVRVMNLHKAKGLEAEVVFLADPSGEHSYEVGFHIDRSGPRVLGYLALRDESRGHAAGRLIASPAGWDSLAAKEQEFLDAERVRLFYVAATRARRELIVVRRERGNHYNPWRFFEDQLEDRPELEVPSRAELAPRADAAPAPAISGEVDADTICAEAASVAGAIRARWFEALAPGYDVLAARASALGERASGEEGLAAEHGAVVHRLLELAAGKPDADLRAAAEALGLPRREAQEAADRARAVMRSELWERSRRARRRLVETPFAARLARGLVRGIIDMAFLEDDGWVVVDYKTDRVEGDALRLAAGRYMPQVRLYAEALAESVREPVKELGLFFAHGGVYVSERVG